MLLLTPPLCTHSSPFALVLLSLGLLEPHPFGLCWHQSPLVWSSLSRRSCALSPGVPAPDAGPRARSLPYAAPSALGGVALQAGPPSLPSTSPSAPARALFGCLPLPFEPCRCKKTRRLAPGGRLSIARTPPFWMAMPSGNRAQCGCIVYGL